MNIEKQIKLLTASITDLAHHVERANALFENNHPAADFIPAALEHTVETVAPQADVPPQPPKATIPPPAPPTPPTPPTESAQPSTPVPPVDEVAETPVDTTSLTFENIPEIHERPFAAVKKKPRNSRPEIELNKILANRDATDGEIQEAKNAVYDYMIKRVERSLRRLNNVETSTVKTANELQLAIKYEEIELEHYVSLVDGAKGVVDVDGGALKQQLTEAGEEIAPPPNAPAPTPPTPPVVDTTRGAPVGFTLTDLATPDLTYQSFVTAGWSDEQLLTGGMMVAVEVSITIDSIRDTLMELSQTKSSEALVACIGKYGLELEMVPEADYPALMNDLHSVADA